MWRRCSIIFIMKRFDSPHLVSKGLLTKIQGKENKKGTVFEGL